MPSLAERSARGRQMLVAGVVVNSLLAFLKLGAGWTGNSDALVADGHFIARRVKDTLMGGRYHLLDVTVHIEPAGPSLC